MGNTILIQAILSQILCFYLSRDLIRSACVRVVQLDRIGFEKYVYRQIFSFDFYLGFFKGSSKFPPFYPKIPLIPNSSEVCLYDTFLPIGWRKLIFMKKSFKFLDNHSLQGLSWETLKRPPNTKCIIFAFFKTSLSNKRRLRILKQFSEEIVDQMYFWCCLKL